MSLDLQGWHGTIPAVFDLVLHSLRERYVIDCIILQASQTLAQK